MSLRQTFISIFLTFVCLGFFSNAVNAQLQTKAKQPKATPAIVVDERLSILRFEPSLSSIILQRLSQGREIKIIGAKQADGVIFYRVIVPPQTRAWIQSEAVASTVRKGDDTRVFNLIKVSEGFDRLERARIFLEVFATSPYRAAVLLMFGDEAARAAEKLSRDTISRLDKKEMEASGAPLHSFYMSFNLLDRYRRQGVTFSFDMEKKKYVYDGAAWREILKNYPNSPEAQEAKKRLGLIPNQ
jgi:hypothetical protein